MGRYLGTRAMEVNTAIERAAGRGAPRLNREEAPLRLLPSRQWQRPHLPVDGSHPHSGRKGIGRAKVTPTEGRKVDG
eukprot:scaffold9836_cov26-Tisochrysis_lutea.AAC.6